MDCDAYSQSDTSRKECCKINMTLATPRCTDACGWKPLLVGCRCGWEGEDRQLIRVNKYDRDCYCPACGRHFKSALG